MVAPVQSGGQEMDKSLQFVAENVVPWAVWATLLNWFGFINFFAAIFRVVAQVLSGSVPRYSLVSIPPSTPTINEIHVTVIGNFWSMEEEFV